jgi:hypothetical protein
MIDNVDELPDFQPITQKQVGVASNYVASLRRSQAK